MELLLRHRETKASAGNVINTQPLKKTTGKDTTFGEHLRQQQEQKKTSLKGGIIEFFKVLGFVFTP